MGVQGWWHMRGQGRTRRQGQGGRQMPHEHKVCACRQWQPYSLGDPIPHPVIRVPCTTHSPTGERLGPTPGVVCYLPPLVPCCPCWLAPPRDCLPACRPCAPFTCHTAAGWPLWRWRWTAGHQAPSCGSGWRRRPPRCCGRPSATCTAASATSQRCLRPPQRHDVCSRATVTTAPWGDRRSCNQRTNPSRVAVPHCHLLGIVES